MFTKYIDQPLKLAKKNKNVDFLKVGDEIS